VNGIVASAESAVASVDVGLRPLLVNAKQAARLLGIGRTTLYELIKAGAVTPVHIGRCVRFSVTDLERFVASGCAVDVDTGQVSKPDHATTRPRSSRRAAPHGVTPRLFDPAS
jgi:excisionase family DNA binding protein